MQDLFRDAEFAQWTGTWLKALEAVGSDDVPSEWLEQYRRTLLAAMAHLNDDEVEFIARSSLLAPFRNAALCERLGGNVPTGEELARMTQSAKPELPRYFRALKRVYLAALANQTARPLPTQEQIQAANLQMLAQMGAAERERMLKFLAQPGGSDAENCAHTAAYLAALDAATGEGGRLLRRAFVVAVLRMPFDAAPPGAPAAATATTAATGAAKGTAGGQFTPGHVQLEYPVHAANAGIEGSMRVRVWVDAQGRATRVKTIERQFNKPFVTLSDGTPFGVDEIFDPLVTVYYRAGRFVPRLKDGKPQPYVIDIPVDWKLE